MLKKIIVKIMGFLPIKKQILFESAPDFSDNTYWLFKYLVETKNIQNSYKLIWFVSNYKTKKDTLCGVSIICVNNNDDSILNLIKKMYYILTSKIIIDCNCFIQKRRKNQIRVHLTHGMPIKDCSEYFNRIGSCDVLSIMGKGFISLFDSFVDDSNIKCTGLPRNEILCQNKPCLQKFIVWMPTYRQHKNKKKINENIFPMGVPVLKNKDDIKHLDEFLESLNVFLLLRLHPAQDTTFFTIKDTKNILIADDTFLKMHGVNLYELLSFSSGLITDYSSVYYDYLLTNRPIGLTMEDAHKYNQDYGLLFKDIKNEIPGYQIDTMDDLYKFILDIKKGNNFYMNQFIKFKEKYGIKALSSSDLIYKQIMTKLENNNFD